MNEETQVTLFSYTGMDTETATYLQENAHETRGLMKRTVEDIVKIGQNLLEAKARLPHGQFLPWIKAELGISQSTAWRFMQTAQGKEIKKKSFTVNDLMDQIGAPAPPPVDGDPPLFSTERLMRMAKRAIEIGIDIRECAAVLTEAQLYAWAKAEFNMHVQDVLEFMNFGRVYKDVPVEAMSEAELWDMAGKLGEWYSDRYTGCDAARAHASADFHPCGLTPKGDVTYENWLATLRYLIQMANVLDPLVPSED